MEQKLVGVVWYDGLGHSFEIANDVGKCKPAALRASNFSEDMR